MTDKHEIEVGSWNNLPHYAITGHPQRFYVWINEDGRGKSSNWIVGKQAFKLYNELRTIKCKKELIGKLREIFSLVGKMKH